MEYVCEKLQKKYGGTLFFLSKFFYSTKFYYVCCKQSKVHIIGFFMTHTLRSKNVSFVEWIIVDKILTKTSFNEKSVFLWRKRAKILVLFGIPENI